MNLNDECCFPGRQSRRGDESSGVFAVTSLRKDVCELLPNCIRQLPLHTTLLGLFPIVTIDISNII